MKVPQLDQSVGIDAISAPSIKAPDPVPGQFGEQVNAALINAGEAGSQLSQTLMNHIQKENYWKGQAKIATDHENLKTSFSDMISSTDPVVKPGKFSNTAPLSPANNANAAGSIETQPKGFLNRQGFNATGSTAEFSAQAKPLLDQFIAPYKKDPSLMVQAQRKFSELYASYYDQVSKHEATQYRGAMNNTFSAQTVSNITATSSATNPESLKAGIDLIKQSTTQQFQYKGADQQEIDNHIANNIGDAVSKSVVNTLTASADLNKAQGLLDTAKDQLTPDRYEKISSMLTTGYKRMQDQAHIASVHQTIQGQSSLLVNLAAGKANWMNIDDVTNLVKSGVVSEKFGKAYNDVLASKGNYQPQEAKNENVPKFIESIYNAKDQTQLHDTLISMMEEHKQMSQDEMAILINSAMKRSGSLPLDTKLSSPTNVDPKQLNIDAGARAVVNFGKRNGLSSDEISFMYANYYNKASTGASVPDAINNATRQYAIAKFPVVATMSDTPHAVVSPDNKVKYLQFDSGAQVYPSRVWNPKTGVFDVNQNRAKSSGGKKPEAK